MGRFGDFFKKVGGAFKKVGGGIKKAFNWVKDKIAPTIGKILPFVKPLVGMIPGVGPGIQKGIEIGEKVLPIADKFVNGSGQDRKDMLQKVAQEGISRMSGGGGGMKFI
jgi:hypothetical protein